MKPNNQPPRKPRLFVALVMAILLLLTASRAAAPRPFVDTPTRERIYAMVDSAQTVLERRELKAAARLYQSALELAKSQKDYLAAAALQNLLGDLLERSERYQEALRQYEFGLGSLQTKQAGQLAAPVGEIISQLRGMEKIYRGGRGAPVSADLYRGEIADLRKLLRQDKANAHQELAILLMINTGNMYLQQYQFRQADSLYAQALRVARAPQTRWRQQLWANLAWSAIKNRQFEQAGVWLDSVLLNMPVSSPPVELRRALLAVGVTWREQGSYNKAVGYLQHALSLYKTANDARGECRAWAHLATTYLYANDLRNAEKNYLTALQLNQNVQDDETGWHANGGLAKCYHRLGELEQAARYYERYLKRVEQIGESWGTDQGKITILQNHEEIFQDYVEVALEVAEKKRNFALARNAIERIRGRALSDLQAFQQQQSQEQAGHLPVGYFFFREQWRDLQFKFSGGVRSGLDVRQTAPNVPSNLSNVFSGAVPSGVGLVALETDTVMPPPVTFLEYFVLPERIVIFVKSRDGTVHGALVPIKADSLRDLVADYGRAIDIDAPRGMKFTRDVELVPEKEDTIAAKRSPTAVGEHEISRQLFQQLLAPVTSFLPAEPQHVVVIVPHQSLWQLPFAALRNAENRFFGEAHVLTYAASESSWRRGARQRRQADHRNIRAWIAGNPKMPASLPACGNTVTVSSLPGAQQEAKEIARLLGKNAAELFIGNQADRLRLEAWHADFSVLHFATHGFACSNDPLSSFIVLTALNAGQLRLDKNAETISSAADARFRVTLDSLQKFLANPETSGMAELFYPGVLEARTIITRFHLKADLVTLSACQTGLGQLSNEGNIGLSRAFLAAGARSFVVSLWSVDDEATKDFMLAFYQEYLRHGNKGLALQNAMQRTRQRYPEPKYWAAFTLMGMAE